LVEANPTIPLQEMEKISLLGIVLPKSTQAKLDQVSG
jgi:hypothetical protein